MKFQYKNVQKIFINVTFYVIQLFTRMFESAYAIMKKQTCSKENGKHTHQKVVFPNIYQVIKFH